MTIRSAFSRALACYRRQWPDMLRYTCLMFIIHLMPLAPLLCLADTSMAVGAWAALPLYLMLILPLRQNAAICLQGALQGQRLFDIRLVSFQDYGKKLLQGLKRGFLLTLWALPAILPALGLYWLYHAQGVQGKTDAQTLLMPVRNVFGGGDVLRGIINLALIYLCLWLPLAAGCGFHSGARHCEALEQKKLLRGHRLGQWLNWLCAQVTLLPWLISLCIPLAAFAPRFMEALRFMSLSGMIPPASMLVSMGVLTLVLLFPALPLRDLIIAAYPAQAAEQSKEKTL